MEGEMKQKRSADDAERVKFLKTTFEGELKNAGSKKVGSLLKDCLQVWDLCARSPLCVCRSLWPLTLLSVQFTRCGVA